MGLRDGKNTEPNGSSPSVIVVKVELQDFFDLVKLRNGIFDFFVCLSYVTLVHTSARYYVGYNFEESLVICSLCVNPVVVW